MTVRLVVEDVGFGLRAAVLEDGRLVELRDQDLGGTQVTDELFLARVGTVEPKLNAAFLDCGLATPAFIAAKDARAVAGGGGRRPIRELLREGQRLVVQGLREAADDKGARFTADIRLFGLALVHTPLNPQPDHARGGRELDGARERAQALFPDGLFALRRHAASLGDDALRAEAALLRARWDELRQAAEAGRKPGRLATPERPLERLLRSLLGWSPTRIEVADTALWAELRRLREQAPAFPPDLELVRLPDDQPAFASAGVEEQVEQALAAEVPLAKGGRLRIEPTAAGIAIDVDGGGRASLDTNLDAAAEIARQVRLRNLGGTIFIDFIDLAQRGDQRRLEEAVKRAFRRDPLPVEVHTLPALGLVVLSRARRGEPLSARLQRPCPRCEGEGRVAGLRSEGERLLAELRGRTVPPGKVHLAPDLEAFLSGEEAAPWRQSLTRIGPVALVRDPALAPGSYRVEG